MWRASSPHDERAHVQLLTWHALVRQENRADLEEAEIALHPREVVLRAPAQRVEHVTAEKRLVLRERIRDANVAAVRAADEGHRTRLEETRADERVADAAGEQPLRIVGHIAGAERPNLVGKGVVAAEPRHFLDQVD